MKRLRIAVTLAFCLLIVSFAYAHPGGTDSSGGHHVGGSSEYHYHHGYSAHSHRDMDGDGDLDCPYDFKDNTKPSNSSSGTKTEASAPDFKKKKLVEYVVPILVCLSLPGLIWAWDKLKYRRR